MELWSMLSLLLILLCLMYIFLVIGLLCDNHLIPAVECLIRDYHIPEELAAVTLIAFGSAAPEILLNSVSVFEDSADLSLPAIFGSGMIAFGFIPSICILNTGLQEHPLHVKPILREVGFYLLGLIIFLRVIQDQLVTTLEALSLLSVYVAYVCTVLYAHTNDQEEASPLDIEDNAIPAEEIEASAIDSRQSNSSLQYGVNPANSVGFDDPTNILPESELEFGSIEAGSFETMPQEASFDLDKYSRLNNQLGVKLLSSCLRSLKSMQRIVLIAFESVKSRTELVLSYFVVPLHLGSSLSLMDQVRYVSLPTSSNDLRGAPVPEQSPPPATIFRIAVIMCNCLLYVGISASLIVDLCHALVQFVDLDSATIGATLLAFGSEVPDIMSSIALAKRGFYDGAMAGAIGSQVINISVAIGFPALIKCLFSSSLYTISTEDQNSLWLLVTLVATVVGGYVFAIAPVRTMLNSCLIDDKASFTRRGALGLFAVWLSVYCAFVYINEFS